MIYLIGSGPAGVSCASALLAQGLTVTMLDAAVRLEGDKQQSLDQLQTLPPEQWHGASVEFLKHSVAAGPMGVRQKQAFGSSYPYQGLTALAEFQPVGTDASPSLAQGGLSTVWGAAMLPYAAPDIDTWPITLEELAPHYRAVLADVHVSAAEDDLAQILPLYTDRAAALNASKQAIELLADLHQHKEKLHRAGIRFGSSRLAVRADSCVYCGLCLYGCPYHLIYNSADSLSALKRNPNFRYMPDCLVKRLEETPTGVRIDAISRTTGRPMAFVGDRVYLAAGPIGSTQILLESLQAFDTPVPLLDSCLFLLPLLRYRSAGNVQTERLHTLAQAFIEIEDPSVSSRLVHAQIYSYNDLYPAALAEKLGRFRSLGKHLLGRLLIAQCYLHSDFSPKLTITLSRTDTPPGRRLSLVADSINNPTSQMVNRAVKKFWTQRSSLRLIPLRPGMQIAPPGRGFHSGGTFPMTTSPSAAGPFHSDILGRPAGLKRIYLVDSTVFPSIPATTITLSVMANARPIASRYGDS
jgi:choline dehydrogenase-like flavoprotein